MSTATKIKLGSDPAAIALQSRIDASVAATRGMINSWLPSGTNISSTSAPDSDDEEAEMMFKPAPPRLGVGATPPASFIASQSKDILRRNILGGRKATKAMPEELKKLQKQRKEESESEDEEGRSALGGGKKRTAAGGDLRKDNKNKKTKVVEAKEVQVAVEVREDKPKPVKEKTAEQKAAKKAKKEKQKQKMVEEKDTKAESSESPAVKKEVVDATTTKEDKIQDADMTQGGKKRNKKNKNRNKELTD
ncbi:hypothetical protein FPQ18DRAFT_107693 [Pyronema domesticum]|uniref:Uncharacterized protein n=1 Tax=Pyronema omphalodes (strain CBS 100304) TaxID=1076935 RepID=U4LHI7_PYROM|nr:hypothetical protein FPQ18DRAFT_107693 [Pyronema domesticum]CCX31594.1 Protein of unknown function [Pyronema omphalodes CBS 100304]